MGGGMIQYAANDEGPAHDIARMASELAQEMGADYARKVLLNITRALEPMCSATQGCRMLRIAEEVAAKHGVTVDHLRGRSNLRIHAWPRHEAFARCYDLRHLGERYSTNAIGHFFGGRDHATVLSGIRRHKARQAQTSEETVNHVATPAGADSAP